MGLIVSAINRIKPSLELVFDLAGKVNTSLFQADMEETVMDAFTLLKPLSYRLRKVCIIEKGYYDYTYLCVGEWLRVKRNYQRKGNMVKYKGDFFKFIREYGDLIKPHVRKPIRDEFSSLVDLSKQLIVYDTLRIKIEIPETEVYLCDFDRYDKRVNVITRRVKGLGVSTDYSWHVILYLVNEGTCGLSIYSMEYASIIEDIIDYIIELYRNAYIEVSRVKEHNDRILREIRDVVEPFRVANAIKG